MASITLKDAALAIRRDQKWIDEAIASGPETPLTKKEMKAIRDRVLRRKSDRLWQQAPALSASIRISQA